MFYVMFWVIIAVVFVLLLGAGMHDAIMKKAVHFKKNVLEEKENENE